MPGLTSLTRICRAGLNSTCAGRVVASASADEANANVNIRQIAVRIKTYTTSCFRSSYGCPAPWFAFTDQRGYSSSPFIALRSRCESKDTSSLSGLHRALRVREYVCNAEHNSQDQCRYL